jgi:hypothetical protein
MALRHRKYQKDEDNCTIRSFIICVLHQMVLGHKINNGEWAGHVVYTGTEKYIVGKPLVRPRYEMDG